MSKDIQFAEGLYFNPPSERAPDFILGNISIRPAAFKVWLEGQEPNEKGYVRLVVKRSQQGKVYIAVDDWEPKQSGPTLPADDDLDDDSSIPF